ncbi:MAG: gamma-glutamyltransferase family protein [Burkholderiales bacterium]
MSVVAGCWRGGLAAALLGFISACAAPPPAPPAPLASADRPEQATATAPSRTVAPTPVFRRQAIAAAHPLAAAAGLQMLRAGGSAVDAAVAVQAVLGLVEPQSSGLGGGAFLLVAEGTAVSAWDGRETAPAAADASLFLDANAKPLPFVAAMASARSVGVPGVLRMLEAAHRVHGRLPWTQLFAPAIQLAEHGFSISPRLAAQLAGDAWLKADPVARALYYSADGRPLAAGQRLRNPDYADLLRRLAAQGADAFYRGVIAAAIVRTVQSHPHGAGRLSLTDLASYQPVRREALCLPWRAWRVCGMPPPSSGMLALGQILQLVDLSDSGNSGNSGNTDQVGFLHRYIEASRLAFADRDQYVADPAFVAAPGGDWRRLWDTDYLSERARLIGPRAMPAAAPGRLAGQPLAWAMDASAEVPATSHVSIIDAQGQAVAMTTSIEAQFGSRILVNSGSGQSGGFLLNNQLTDFSFVAERGGLPVANRVEPGKRPRSSMAPTLVFDAQGRLVASLGAPGGPAIIHYVAKTLWRLYAINEPLAEAIAAPNIGPLSGRAGTPVWVERGAWDDHTLAALRALGHPLMLEDMPSGVQALVRDSQGRWQGGADPRREGVALGD